MRNFALLKVKEAKPIPSFRCDPGQTVVRLVRLSATPERSGHRYLKLLEAAGGSYAIESYEQDDRFGPKNEKMESILKPQEADWLPDLIPSAVVVRPSSKVPSSGSNTCTTNRYRCWTIGTKSKHLD